MKIANESVVSMHYELKDDEGTILDSSEGKEPLKYLHGAQNIIPGLENALVDKTVGDKLDVSVDAKDGYGEVIKELVQEVPKDVFGDVEKIEPGMVFQAQDQEGRMQNFTVQAVNDDKVTIDANHPLAGKKLHFSVTIEEVREASKEELEHGHVH